MPAVTVLSVDGSKMAWQDFVQALREIKFAHERGEVFARVRPPERCGLEARKVVRDLGLADCVELLDPDASVGAGAPTHPTHPTQPRVQRAPGTPLVQALAWLFARRSVATEHSRGRSGPPRGARGHIGRTRAGRPRLDRPRAGR